MAREQVTAETIHGDIEYEVEQCDYCPNGALPDDAINVVVGDAYDSWGGHDPPHVGVTTADHSKVPEVNTACKECARSLFGYEGEAGTSRGWETARDLLTDGDIPPSVKVRMIVIGVVSGLGTYLLGITF